MHGGVVIGQGGETFLPEFVAFSCEFVNGVESLANNTIKRSFASENALGILSNKSLSYFILLYSAILHDISTSIYSI